MNETQKCPSRYQLERYFYEKVTPTPFDSHHKACVACQAQWSQMTQQHESFLKDRPFDFFMQQLQIRQNSQKTSLAGILSWVREHMRPLQVGVVMAGFGALMVTALWQSPSHDSYVGLKGKSPIVFYVKDQNEAVLGKNEQKLLVDTPIEFSLKGAGPYAMLVGVESSGNVTYYFPVGPVDGNTESPALNSLSQNSIAIAWHPASSSQYERFFLISSKTPFHQNDVRYGVEQTRLNVGADPKKWDEIQKLPADSSQKTLILYRSKG